MNLLLILSALFSALTGAMGSRVPEIPLHRAATTVRAAAQAVPARAVALRPEAGMPELHALASYPGDAAFAIAPAVPAYASRRRV